MVILSLLVANIWVLLYQNLLMILNSLFPFKSSVDFIRIGASPEPFEISLYLVLTFIFVFTLYAVFRLRKFFQPKENSRTNSIFVKGLIILLLIAVFLSNIGQYPMAHSHFPYLTAESPLTYRLFLIGYLVVTLFLIAEAYILDRMRKEKRHVSLIYAFFLLFAAAIVLFEPGFPMEGHDYSYFLGPIWEVVNGKTIFTDVPSQYGFVSILFFAFFYKIQLFSPFVIPIFIWVLYVFEYGICFYLVYKIGRSLVIATIALISVLTINYFSVYHLPISVPQIGPMRFFPLIFTLFLFYRYKSIHSKKFIAALSLCTFWVLDGGVSIILTYLSTLGIFYLCKKISFKTLIVSTIFFGVMIIAVFASINLLHIILGYKVIDIALVYSKLSEYAKAGFGMLPIDSLSYFWFVPLIYFASILYVLKMEVKIPFLSDLGGSQERARPRSEKNGIEFPCQLLLFSANLSLFASIYFVGRSHPHNLFHIALFPILNAFILLSLIFKSKSYRYQLLLSSIAFIIFILIPLYNRQEIMTKTIKEKFRYLAAGYLLPATEKLLHLKYQEEKELIMSTISEKEILILSPDDTYLFYVTGKKNLMNDNSQFTILTERDMHRSLKKVYKTCPDKIVVDCTLFQQCTDPKPFTKIVGFNIQPLLLSRVETACQTSYKPTTCTKQLCIANKQNNP